jgi:hypothetical protein
LLHWSTHADFFDGSVHDAGGSEHVAEALLDAQPVAHAVVQMPHQHSRPLPHSAEDAHVSNQFVLLPPA